MILTTYDDIRAALRHEIRSEVRDEVWEKLDEDGSIEDVWVGAATVKELAARYKQFIKDIEGEERDQESEKQIGPDEQLMALSWIMARKASQNSEVKLFRDEVLNGMLLSQDEVEDWIKKHSEEDGPVTVYLTFPVPSNRLKRGKYGVPWTEPEMLIQEDNPPVAWSQDLLSYQTPTKEATCRIPVARYGVLGKLHVLSQKLASTFKWSESQAAVFVLTGVPPMPSRAVLHIDREWPYSVNSRIHLVIDPTLSPQAVMDIYRKARTELGQNHHRPMSSKHLKLAEFYGGEKEGTWASMMRKWNQSFSKEWRYDNVRNFGRDCQSAWRRIFGEEEFPEIAIDGKKIDGNTMQVRNVRTTRNFDN